MAHNKRRYIKSELFEFIFSDLEESFLELKIQNLAMETLTKPLWLETFLLIFETFWREKIIHIHVRDGHKNNKFGLAEWFFFVFTPNWFMLWFSKNAEEKPMLALLQDVNEDLALYKILGEIPSSQAIIAPVALLVAVARGGILWLVNLMFFIAVAVTSFKKQRF